MLLLCSHNICSVCAFCNAIDIHLKQNDKVKEKYLMRNESICLYPLVCCGIRCMRNSCVTLTSIPQKPRIDVHTDTYTLTQHKHEDTMNRINISSFPFLFCIQGHCM